MSGSNETNQLGNYGTLGESSPSNVPGSRQLAVGWTASDGSLWLFGGGGIFRSRDCLNLLNLEFFNDLWKWDGTYWTWMSGSSTTNQQGNY